MSRKTETIDRDSWEACLDMLNNGDIQDQLREELGDDTCEWIACSVDSVGRIDSMSSPRPGRAPAT